MRVIRNNGAFFIDNGKGRIFNINFPEGAGLRLEDKKGVDTQINEIKVKEARNRLNESILAQEREAYNKRMAPKGLVGPRKEENYTVETVNVPPVKAPANRMAGQEVDIDKLLNSLEENVARETRAADLESDAIQYIGNRSVDLNQLGLVKENSSLGNSENILYQQEDKGVMQGNIPLPLIDQVADGEIRKHIEFKQNPITGINELVPILDPNDRRKVLETTYGTAGIDPEAGHQSEPAMMNAMKLQGMKVEYNDPVFTNERGYTGTEGKADLAGVDSDGNIQRMDVMYQGEGKPLELPMYTNIWPRDSNGMPIKNFSRDKSAYNQALDLIKAKLSELGTNDYQSAVQKLVLENKLGPSDGAFMNGKLLKGDSSVTPKGEHFYDGLIVPRYPSEVNNRRGDASPQRTPTAPDNIFTVDLQQAVNALKSGKAGATVRPQVNYATSGKGHERLQLKPQFEYSEDVGVKDMTIDNPLVQQLLSTRAMNQRLV